MSLLARDRVAFGATPLPEQAIGRLVGDGAAMLVARAFAAAGGDPPEDALDRFLTIYNEHLLDHTRPYPGMREVLDALRPRAALAVLTNKPLAATRRVLAGVDLAQFFSDDRVIGGDGPFARKPDPAAAPIDRVTLVTAGRLRMKENAPSGRRIASFQLAVGERPA